MEVPSTQGRPHIKCEATPKIRMSYQAFEKDFFSLVFYHALQKLLLLANACFNLPENLHTYWGSKGEQSGSS